MSKMSQRDRWTNRHTLAACASLACNASSGKDPKQSLKHSRFPFSLPFLDVLTKFLLFFCDFPLICEYHFQ